jgi:hypothetical protein
LYRIFRKLGNGEFMHIASRHSPEDALELVATFKSLWPDENAEYIVRDEDGNDLDLGE